MKIRSLAFSSLLLFLAALMLACGSPKVPALGNCGAVTAQNSSGSLQSISLCPAVADARQYPGNQVQFVATGEFNTSPSPVRPVKTQTWGACYQSSPTTNVTISATGLAQCAPGAAGTYVIFASNQPNCSAITACGGGCQVTGYAWLTCR